MKQLRAYDAGRSFSIWILPLAVDLFTLGGQRGPSWDEILSRIGLS